MFETLREAELLIAGLRFAKPTYPAKDFPHYALGYIAGLAVGAGNGDKRSSDHARELIAAGLNAATPPTITPIASVIPLDAQIRVTSCGEPEIECSLRDFVVSNEFGEDELGELFEALSARTPFRFGGGAAPTFHIERI